MVLLALATATLESPTVPVLRTDTSQSMVPAAGAITQAAMAEVCLVPGHPRVSTLAGWICSVCSTTSKAGENAIAKAASATCLLLQALCRSQWRQLWLQCTT